MTNIMDALGAAQAGYYEYEDFLRKFEEQWAAPMLKLQEQQQAQQILMTWDAMPDDVKANMQQMDPQGFEQAMKAIAELRKNEPVGKVVTRPAASGRQYIGGQNDSQLRE